MNWLNFLNDISHFQFSYYIVLIDIFIIFTSPTSTHALMDAGWEEHNEPKIMEGRPNHLGEDSDQF